MAGWLLLLPDGSQHGPVDRATLAAWARDGRVARETLAWREGLAEWRPVGAIPELSGLFPARAANAGRPHSPLLALLAGLALPGAGQAYNGQPLRALLVLIGSVLLLPWLAGAAHAWFAAQRLAREGGRLGRGGIVWIALQAVAALDYVLFALIILTITGVLR